MPKTVRELRHLAEKNKDKTVRIYNPDTEDFTWKYHGKEYTIPALNMEQFPVDIANHLKKHLADYILNIRGVKDNPEDDLKKIYKEIEVEI